MKGKKGFGMIEISLTIAIISFMTISALSLYNIITRQQNSKLEDLKEKYSIAHIEILDSHARFNKIYDAMKYFIIKNHRLPCPDYNETGIEDLTNECSLSNDVTNSNIKYGDLPYKTLNLTAEFTKDEWNNDISYYVDKRFTFKNNKHNAQNGFTMEKTMYNINNDADIADGRVNDDNFEIIEITDGTNQIVPKDGLDLDMRPNASFLFVLLSSGKDGDRHSENIDNDDNLFTIDSDDILFFKNKQEILKDSGLKYFSCSSQDSKITFNDDPAGNDGNLGNCNNGSEISFKNILHGNNIYSQANCPCNSKNILRKCQSYGIWQDIEEMLTNQCNQ